MEDPAFVRLKNYSLSTRIDAADWHLSLPAYLTERTDIINTNKPKDVLSGHIVTYKGVSLGYVNWFWSRLVGNQIFRDVVIYQLTEECQDLQIGTRMLHQDEAYQEPGMVHCFVPYRRAYKVLKIPAAKLREVPRNEWTIEDVCEFVVLSQTLNTSECYIEHIDQRHVGKPFQGAFVTHARSCSFGELVEALNRFFFNKQKDEVFIWMDLFCANQPLLCRTDRDLDKKFKQERSQLLHKGLHNAIEYFDYRLVFVDDFNKPTVLNRAWCIWEMYGICLANRKMHIICTNALIQEIGRGFENDTFDLLNVLVQVDLTSIQCRRASDLQMINDAVAELGTSKVKQAVTEALRLWAFENVEMFRKDREAVRNGRLQRMKKVVGQNGVTIATGYTKADADFLTTIGRLLNDFEQFENARKCLKTALAIYKETSDDSNSSEQVAKCRQIYANVLKALGGSASDNAFYEKAAREIRKVLDFANTAYHAQKPPSDPKRMTEEQALSKQKIAVCLNFLGDICMKQRNFDEAKSNYEKSRSSFPPSSVYRNSPERMLQYKQSLANLEVNFGEVYRKMGRSDDDYTKALMHFNNAKTILESVGSFRDATLALVYTGIGDIHRCKDQFDEALDCFNLARDIFLELYGENCDLVIDAYKRLGIVNAKLHNWDEAQNSYANALRVVERISGRADNLEGEKAALRSSIEDIEVSKKRRSK